MRELYIRKNKISSFTELEHLKKVPNLTVLWLSENPVVSSQNYRLRVLKTLPQLKKLDNRGKRTLHSQSPTNDFFLVVTEEERRMVKAAEDEKHSGTNITSAILYLLKELNKEELVTLRNTIDKQIQDS